MEESSFYKECRLFLENTCFVIIHEKEGYRLCSIPSKLLVIILLPLRSFARLNQTLLLASIKDLYSKNYQSIVVSEDLWILNKYHIYKRLSVRLGNFERIHARKCQVIPITQTELSTFMDENHSMGAVKSKYKYALSYEDSVVAMASFSGLRKYYRGDEIYNSSELIRFANCDNKIVVGGLSKLLNHFMKVKQPDDIMTYVDRQWSDGSNYSKIGFEKEGVTLPKIFWFHPINHKRFAENRLPMDLIEEAMIAKLPLEEVLQAKGFVKVFDLGNYKFIKRNK